MTLRRYTPSDCAQLINLFCTTVHRVNAKDYSRLQLDAWATGKENLAEWNVSLSAHVSVVAEIENLIVGFGDMDESGYLDRLYVHHGFQRQGIATAICNYLEEFVNADCFITHASITAKPFFLHRGYHVIKKQEVHRRGIPLTNFVMVKTKGNL